MCYQIACCNKAGTFLHIRHALTRSMHVTKADWKPPEIQSKNQTFQLLLVSPYEICQNYRTKWSEVLTAVIMEICVFWAIAMYGPLNVNQCFRGTCHIHLQGKKNSQTKDQHEAGKVRLFFRLYNFNIVGFLLFIFTALHVSVLGPSSRTHIFHRIYSIDNGSVVFLEYYLSFKL
jgi:hypothetical protein